MIIDQWGDFKSYLGYRAYQGRYAGKVAGYKLHDKVADNFYIQINLKGVAYCGHRLVWLYMYGEWPEDIIDHIDGDGLNNKLENLRSADRTINGRNRRMSKNNSSGVNGVYWEKLVNGWVAAGYYEENGIRKKKYLGSYATVEEAEAARLSWQDSQEGYTDRHGKKDMQR